MLTITTIAQMHTAISAFRKTGRSIGFVPTMGALHEGHLSLVRAARSKSDFVVASIFVNPKQFGPNEDLAKYPRPFERDCELLENEKVDVLFAPTVEEMYPAGEATYVYVEGLSERLDGKSRPGHFRGVTTVVAKLFNIIGPDRAYFGQKDSAQAAIVRKMVKDLSISVEIVVGPIIREANGIAMSSRNVYLSAKEREQATVLNRALLAVQSAFDSGERDVKTLLELAAKVLTGETGANLDYIEIVHPDTLETLENSLTTDALVAVAAKFGSTRLIDNIVLSARK